MNKRFPLYVGIGAWLIVAAVIGGGAYFLFRPSATSTPVDTVSTSDDSTPGAFANSVGSTTAAATSAAVSITSATLQALPNSKQYQSSEFHFSFYYPDHLAMSQQGVGGNSVVLLFKDQTRSEGFQVFVTPYGDPKITQERFNMDEPSGVMNSPQNITIDGAPATEFLSSNPAMGASREIWFLRGGYLYEVTAPQPLDPWLLSIMQTWKFN